jgi:hypothetical protein
MFPKIPWDWENVLFLVCHRLKYQKTKRENNLFANIRPHLIVRECFSCFLIPEKDVTDSVLFAIELIWDNSKLDGNSLSWPIQHLLLHIHTPLFPALELRYQASVRPRTMMRKYLHFRGNHKVRVAGPSTVPTSLKTKERMRIHFAITQVGKLRRNHWRVILVLSRTSFSTRTNFLLINS